MAKIEIFDVSRAAVMLAMARAERMHPERWEFSRSAWIGFVTGSTPGQNPDVEITGRFVGTFLDLPVYLTDDESGYRLVMRQPWTFSGCNDADCEDCKNAKNQN